MHKQHRRLELSALCALTSHFFTPPVATLASENSRSGSSSRRMQLTYADGLIEHHKRRIRLGRAQGLGASGRATVIPLSVDDEGIRLPEGKTLPPALMYVTPSHQFPLGTCMSLGRRLSLLQAAHEAGSWIIEDDYDAEFRYTSGRESSSILQRSSVERAVKVRGLDIPPLSAYAMQPTQSGLLFGLAAFEKVRSSEESPRWRGSLR